MPTTINGTGITFPNGTTQTTAASGAGTVTSVATGNGLQGGTITSTGTLSVACPTYNTVGSYVAAITYSGYPQNITAGSNYSAGSGPRQMRSGGYSSDGFMISNNLSGTWKWMGPSWDWSNTQNIVTGVACRVS